MSLYDYQCSSCKEVIELSKKIADRDNVSEDVCPNCSTVGSLGRCVGAPMVAYSVTVAGGYGKVPDGFKEVLRRIQTRAPGAVKNTSSFL